MKYEYKFEQIVDSTMIKIITIRSTSERQARTDVKFNRNIIDVKFLKRKNKLDSKLRLKKVKEIK